MKQRLQDYQTMVISSPVAAGLGNSKTRTDMFNNVVLDVFIGLVLVFLLYSLLVTIIGEILATWMGLRSRILRVSVEKMLNDGYNLGGGFFSFTQRYFLKEFPDFKESFAGRFYEYPAIKYLSNKAGEQTTFFSQTKPSYLTAEIFADTLIQLIKDKGTGSTDMEKVGYSLKYNAHHIQQATLKHLADMFENSAGSILMFKEKLKAWYNETQDRATGWYKRKLQLILFWLGFVIAVIFNVDTLRIARILSKDKEARNEMVEMGIQLAKDTNRYKDFVMPNGDTIHSQQVLDTSFARIKKDIDEANLVLGLGWPIDKLNKKLVSRVDSLKEPEQYRLLASSPYITLFMKLKANLDSADKYLANLNKRRNDSIQLLQKTLLDSINFRVSLFSKDSLSREDSLKDSAIHQQITSLQNDLRRIRPIDSNIISVSRIVRKNIDRLRNTIDSITGIPYLNFDSVRLEKNGNNPVFVVYLKRNYWWYEKVWYVIRKTLSPATFIGFFITALMLSLGAPFWFDLLKKLVSLRGAGVKPEEKKPDQTADSARTTGSGDVDLVPVPQKAVPVEQVLTGLALAVKMVQEKLVTVKGVLSVEEGFIKQNNEKKPAVEVHVENDLARQQVFAKVGDVIAGNPINYFIVTEPTAHQGPGGEIGNLTRTNGFGTLGCFLRKKDSTDLFLLSCWHVLKANTDWSGSLGDPNIVLNDDTKIARIVDGMLADSFDIGIAQCNSNVVFENTNNGNLGITKPWRRVTVADAVHEFPVRFLGRVTKGQNAVIYNHRVRKFLRYPDNHHLLVDLFSITLYDSNRNPTSPSSEGDSGAVVVGSDGCPLGVLIGGDDKFSYVAKFSNFMDEGTTYRNYSIIA